MSAIYNNSSVTINTSNNVLTYGPYTISVGNQNSVIQPDLGTLTLISDTTDATGYVTGNNITFQSNTITAGNGTDTIYGTMYELDVTSNDFVFHTIFNVLVADNIITFNGNNISVGNGANDTVYGTMFEMSLLPTSAGIIGGLFGGYGPNVFTFDSTTIAAGNGADDTLYGTMYELSLATDTHGFIGGFVGG